MEVSATNSAGVQQEAAAELSDSGMDNNGYTGVVKDVFESWTRLKANQPDFEFEFGSTLILQ